MRAGDLEPAAGADEVGETALLDDDVVRLVGVGEEGGQRVGDGLGAGGAARQREADQPRQETGEVAPADRERAVGVAQVAGDAGEDAGGGDGHDAAEADDAGIAGRGAGTGRQRVDQGDVVAVALEEEGAGAADNAGADDDDAHGSPGVIAAG